MSDGPTPEGGVRVALVSLGCAKNLVDSENLLGTLDPDRFALCPDPADADVAVVNTCAFLEAAREESIDAILELARLKTRGRLRGLVVAGCIVPRHEVELRAEIPEVDAFLPFADYGELPAVCLRLAGREVPPDWRAGPIGDVRLPLTPSHTAYLKVAEGCSNACSFCLIPRIRGKLVSRTLEDLVSEAESRVRSGAVELNLIAQDLTDWGRDLHGERHLPVLLRALGRIEGLRWIRLLYAYPAHVTPDLIREMAENPRIVRYLDMPVQHASDPVRRRMRRRLRREALLDLVDRLRTDVPGLALRTTVLVGHPGETESDFEVLLDFLREVRFERLGAFLFSPEEGTPSAAASDPVPEEVGEERFHRVMALQRDITFAQNRERIGSDLECLVEAPDGAAGAYRGRTYADAPDIDGTILIQGDGLAPGRIGSVRVTAADGYDLEGTWGSEIRP